MMLPTVPEKNAHSIADAQKWHIMCEQKVEVYLNIGHYLGKVFVVLIIYTLIFK